MAGDMLPEYEIDYSALRFLSVDLTRHADLCVQFVADTYLCSYGTMDGFEEDASRLLERMHDKMRHDPKSCLHIWQGSNIIGQLNFGTFVDPGIGYISHFYLVPEWRGKGFATQMEAYAEQHFRRRGFSSARLSVVAANTRAVRFYQKHGWQNLGPRADNPVLHNMEKIYV